MQKIMLNDKLGLTEAVLEGRKTMTRRIIKAPRTMDGKDVYGFSVVSYRNGEIVEVMAVDEDGAMINNILPKYKVGEVVAVAQSYHSLNKSGYVAPEWLDHYCEDSAGYENKMFVRADLMPHHIRITNVRVERLQDISDEDCLREGIVKDDSKMCFNGYAFDYCFDQHGNMLASRWYKTPREAFAALIDKVSGKGTWEANPWVYVYEFELVK